MNDSSSNSSQKKPWGFLKVLSWWEIGALTYWAFSQLVSQFFSCKTVSREWTYLAGNCIFQQSFVLILGGRRKVFNFFFPSLAEKFLTSLSQAPGRWTAWSNWALSQSSPISLLSHSLLFDLCQEKQHWHASFLALTEPVSAQLSSANSF